MTPAPPEPPAQPLRHGQSNSQLETEGVLKRKVSKRSGTTYHHPLQPLHRRRPYPLRLRESWALFFILFFAVPNGTSSSLVAYSRGGQVRGVDRERWVWWKTTGLVGREPNVARVCVPRFVQVVLGTRSTHRKSQLARALDLSQS